MRDIAVKLLEEVEANKLPSLPHILIKLLQACREEDVCFDTLSELISQDASLCTKVIKAANSPVYGRARNLNSLKHTLLFLGLDTIKSIAITASIKQFFSEYSSQKTSFLKNFWYHSLTCATIARSLAELTSYPYIEEAYIAGLLHDIGKMMLEPMMDADYKSMDHGGYAAEQILNSEKEAFGLSHSELAAILLEKWNLPDVVCDAVRYHHAPLDNIQQAHHLSKIINLANLLASDLQESQLSQQTEAAIKLFDLSAPIIEKLVQQSKDKSRSIALSMDIDIGDSEASHQQDELKQIELAQEVRDNSLVISGQNAIKTGTNEIYKSIQKSISLLLGINESLILTPNNDLTRLQVAQPQHLPESKLATELDIEISSDCLISRCLTQQQVTDSFSAQSAGAISILDEQISRGLKTSGFICLPVTKNNHHLAVIILGCEHNKAIQTLNNKSLLSLFTSNIADKISDYLKYEKAISNITTTHTEEFLQRAKQIIHETNNPLSVIRNYLQLLSKKLDSNDPAQSELNTIKQEIDRIANIIIRCKETNDTSTADYSRLDLNQLINELIDVYKASLFKTHNISAVLELDSSLGKIDSDKDIIKQIITNLVKNSVEAIVNNGEITITTGNINIDGKNFIELKLKDTGKGIPVEIMKNLYKPVTSTKGKAHSGLGLSITKNLVNRIGGSISCKTDKAGTVFSVQFPEET